MSPEDTARLEQIRSKLYNYVANSSEETDDVKRARAMLGRIPKSAPRGPSLGSQPAVAPDYVSQSDVNPDYSKRDVHRYLAGQNDTIGTPETNPGPRRPLPDIKIFPHSVDEAVQGLKDSFTGIPKALAAGYQGARLLAHDVGSDNKLMPDTGAVQREMLRGVNSTIPFANYAVEAAGGPDADSSTDAAAAPGVSQFGSIVAAPVTGKMLGGIAGKGIEAAGKLDNAIGERAVATVNNPDRVLGAGKKARAVGHAAGFHIGYKMTGWPGGVVGGGLGGEAADMIARTGNKLTDALARRQIRRTTTYTPPEVVDTNVAAPFVDAEVISPKGLPEMPGPRAAEGPISPEAPPVRRQLAPPRQAVSEADIVSNEPAAPAEPRIGGYTQEEWRQINREWNGIKGHTTQGDVTAAGKPGRVPALGLADTQVAPASLRDEVVAGVQKIKNEPPEAQPAEGSSLESQLARSVKWLDDLKKAKAAGTLTPEMEQAAVNAGIPPENVARVVGRKTAASTDNPIAKARREKVRQDAKNARILSGRND